ncbi:putative terpene synthase 2 [Tasmannia lanceolata]|uniref:putative terpene synthase 2 n=1 Tax=Tasmannia lanceolata TaxID=3420 RepID=UPI004062FE7F
MVQAILICASELRDAEVDAWTKRVEELKEEVKRMLSSAKGSQQEIDLINLLQCLGLSYHFEKEINDALHQIFESHTYAADDDLYVVALRFRLLTQHGFNASPDVFNKFRDEQGNLNVALISDMRGLLSLYEAAYLGTQGEHILDEAITFTREQLKSAITNLDSIRLALQVEHALKMPLWKSIPRLEHRYYISIYQQEKGQNDLLLELAKLDFNLLQSLHQKEIKDLTKWWKDMDFIGNMPFAKDRLVELYFSWVKSVYYELRYSRSRMWNAKIISMISVIDDFYDAYGTLDECRLFTNANDRWDVKTKDQIPKYMEVCYLALIDVVNEIEEELAAEGNSYRIPCLKEGIKGLISAYFTEAEWYNKGYIPLLNEHLSLSLVSSGYPMITILRFVGMGDIATMEAFDWASRGPKVIMDASLVCRLRNDIVGNKFEQERGHVASTIQCYVKEHGASEQEVCDKFEEMIMIAWKDINQACLELPVSLTLLMRVVNLKRVMEV